MTLALRFEDYQQLVGVIRQQAAALDEQRWDDWLSLHSDDIIFWLPAWVDENTLTHDPHNEVSLIYLEGKAALSDRVWRFTSGNSPASIPLARTSHVIGNEQVVSFDGHIAVVHCQWHTLVYRRKRSWVYGGSCRYTLRLEAGQWRIGQRYITLTNDQIDTALDLYHL